MQPACLTSITFEFETPGGIHRGKGEWDERK